MQLLLTFQQLAHEVSNVWNAIQHQACELFIAHVKNEGSLGQHLQTVSSLALLQEQLFCTADFEVR